MNSDQHATYRGDERIVGSGASFRWLGDNRAYLDVSHIERCGPAVIGAYGGRVAAGATRNEDGALVWSSADGAWELAALLDAHASSQSVSLVLDTLTAEKDSLCGALAAPTESALSLLQQRVLAIFQSPAFRARCRSIQGETACLLCARKAQFVWWLCIGDCSLYVLHADLARLGQFAVNQRSFYEWVGAVSTFDLVVPCYASGVRELREGRTVIVMATDGLLEYPGSPFANPQFLYTHFTSPDQTLEATVRAALQQVHDGSGRDSATLIAWAYDNEIPGRRPSL